MEKIVYLNISNKGLDELPDLSNYKNLKYFNCSNNNIKSLDGLPKSIKELNCAHNKLTSLDKLPHSIDFLICFHWRSIHRQLPLLRTKHTNTSELHE